ncbi:hypothetical protein M9H77_12005 [Catharanthus roseus]|uniref:Uncharacterized protein n=1 Tax=Catharanthus roseus TaxID=4058 RepID=A0ACC0BG46_CATRO|nr:hypothetical protein M9H77_12005 [Catharanthus roseus]
MKRLLTLPFHGGLETEDFKDISILQGWIPLCVKKGSLVMPALLKKKMRKMEACKALKVKMTNQGFGLHFCICNYRASNHFSNIHAHCILIGSLCITTMEIPFF